MATVTLHPGDVTFFHDAQAPTGGGITGAANQWADGSDATYAVVKASRTLASRDWDEARALLPVAVPADLDVSTVTAVTATIRFQTSNASATTDRQIRVGLSGGGAAITFGSVAGVSDWVVPNDDAIHTLTAGVNEAELASRGRDLAWVADWLKTAFRTAVVSRSDNGVADGVALSLTAYELQFDIEYGVVVDPTVPAVRRQPPPLRLYPRSDGLGMSSARRVDANRSTQASLRRAGGTYH